MKTVEPFLNVMGMLLQGDIAGLTLYTKPGHRIVYFLAAPPKVPESPAQAHQRNRWRNIAKLWRSLSSLERKNWKTVADSNRLSITGYDLYMHTLSNTDSGTARSLARRCGITLHTTPGVPL